MDATTGGDADAIEDPVCPASGPIMSMLSRHLPFSLIMDLAMPAGPHSQELMDVERGLAS
jgi:hypothetical protein